MIHWSWRDYLLFAVAAAAFLAGAFLMLTVNWP